MQEGQVHHLVQLVVLGVPVLLALRAPPQVHLLALEPAPALVLALALLSLLHLVHLAAR